MSVTWNNIRCNITLNYGTQSTTPYQLPNMPDTILLMITFEQYDVEPVTLANTEYHQLNDWDGCHGTV